MVIEIEIPRPLQTLALIAGVVWVVSGGLGGSEQEVAESAEHSHAAAQETDGAGGPYQASLVHEAQEDLKSLRVRQEVLARKREILQYELHALEAELEETFDPDVEEEIRDARRELLLLLKDERAAEKEILASLNELWEAQGYALHASRAERGSGPLPTLEWPIDPELGLSARFTDAGYRARFGFDHRAVDIPVAQGSTIYAPADGIVAKLTDNGMGFNALTLQHSGGMATLYGHVTEFLVEEGDQVFAGDPIALSGGRPHTKGAGHLTTGPHLHFEVHVRGKKVDPLDHLASWPGITD